MRRSASSITVMIWIRQHTRLEFLIIMTNVFVCWEHSDRPSSLHGRKSRAGSHRISTFSITCLW